MDPAFAERIDRDFQKDLGQGREITFEQWKNRSYAERAHELLGQLLERQQ
jgi:hypothetical protein